MPFSPDAAIEIQKLLSKRVKFTPLPPVETVGALDVAYGGGFAYGAAVVARLDSLEIVEVALSINRVVVPYVPTFLAFREITPMLRAYFKLRNKPDVLLVDGHGVAHPRKFGIASHIGVVIEKPTIGVAKTRLYGVEKGATLVDEGGDVIGVVTHCGGKKYISVGSHITLRDAVTLVERLCRENGVFPLDLADEVSKKARLHKPTTLDSWGEAI